MFLHSGASLHGHEYSHRPSQPNHGGPRRSPLLRSPFAAPATPSPNPRPKSIARASTTFEEPSTPRPTALKQPRPFSDYLPRAVELCVRFQEPTEEKAPEPMSDDEVSASIISDSEASQAGGSVRRARRRRRAPRQITSYLFAHPAPKLSTKKRLITHIRPKLLLQVQQLSPGKRPRPTIDVFPSSVVAGSVVEPLLSRFPRIARNRKELSIYDLMLVKSEDYDAEGTDPENDQGKLEKRDLIAILSPLKKADKTEIVLADGTVWTATPQPNGSYEFVMYDQDGASHTARWVRRQMTRSIPATPSSTITSPPSSTPSRSPSPSNDYRFNFSFIDPNTRRHPILASLTTSALEIHDTYTTLSSSASRQPPTSPINIASSHNDGGHPGETPMPERDTQIVEEWMKSFISVSAIWVALQQGWSPFYRRAAEGSTFPSCSTAPISNPPATMPSAAMTSNPSTPIARSRSTSITPEQSNQRTASRHRRIFSAGSVHHDTELRDPPPQALAPLPRRATSTGAAYMQSRSLTHQPQAKRATTMNITDTSSATSMGLSDWAASEIVSHPQPSHTMPVANTLSFHAPMDSGTNSRTLGGAMTDEMMGGKSIEDPLASAAIDIQGGHPHRWSRLTSWFKKLQAR